MWPDLILLDEVIWQPFPISITAVEIKEINTTKNFILEQILKQGKLFKPESLWASKTLDTVWVALPVIVQKKVKASIVQWAKIRIFAKLADRFGVPRRAFSLNDTY